jgi:HPt (histidine-containing phosphotransfer) domain-containing protein
MDLSISGSPREAIDAQSLAQLKLIGGDDAAFVRDMIALFLSQAPQHLHAIERGLALGDVKRIAKASHQLKSSSLYLGARRLSALAAQLEDAARGVEADAFARQPSVEAYAANANAVSPRVEALTAEFRVVRTALEAPGMDD